MPIQLGKDSEGCFAKWGNKGAKYHYTCGDDSELNEAKKKALKQAVAIGEFADSFSDYPQAATENAKIALRWAEENGWGDCGTPVGKIRANQLAKGEPISENTIARMASFERHRQNSTKELGDGCGRLMWLAWGGDEGIEWAQRKLKQIRQIELISQDKISFDYDDTLSTIKGQEMASKLISEGKEVYIITRRSKMFSNQIYKLANKLGIAHDRVFFTGGKLKWETIKKLGIGIHYDNNQNEIDNINKNTDSTGILFKK